MITKLHHEIWTFSSFPIGRNFTVKLYWSWRHIHNGCFSVLVKLAAKFHLWDSAPVDADHCLKMHWERSDPTFWLHKPRMRGRINLTRKESMSPITLLCSPVTLWFEQCPGEVRYMLKCPHFKEWRATKTCRENIFPTLKWQERGGSV